MVTEGITTAGRLWRPGMPLTHSEMQSWNDCQRGWWLTYYRKMEKRSEVTSLPNIGTLFHGGLERYYKGELEVPSHYVAKVLAKQIEANPEIEKQLRKDAEWATIMLDGYIEWVVSEGIDYGYEIIGVEETLEYPIGPSQYTGNVYLLRSKIDARMRREIDGALLQLEHKTVGNLGDIPKYAQSAPQFLTYDLQAFLHARAQEDESLRTDGVLINMARRVKRTPQAKPPFYGRFPVLHNTEELRSHYKHIVAIGDQIATATARLDAGEDPHLVVAPAVNRDHTWRCDCRDIVTMFDDGSDYEGFLAEFYVSVDPLARYTEEEV